MHYSYDYFKMMNQVINYIQSGNRDYTVKPVCHNYF